MLEGPQLMYPPLLPLLSAAVSFATGWQIATAGRFVSVLAGVALVMFIYCVAASAYGRRVAIIAALIATVHPLLISLSGLGYSEAVYLPLLMGGTYFGLETFRRTTGSTPIRCGVCFGLAYLTRPDALLWVAVMCAAIIVVAASGRNWRRAARTTVLILLPVLILGMPYAAYLSRTTGRLQIEGKSVMNYVIGGRMNRGMDLAQAAFGIGADLTEQGPFLSPNVFVETTPASVPLRTAATHWLQTAWNTRKLLLDRLVVQAAFGSVLMVALIAIGMFRRLWTPRRLRVEFVLVSLEAGYVMILLGMSFLELRFLLPLLPIIIVWMAKGIDEASRWASATARRAAVTGALGITARVATVGFLCACLVVLAVRAVRSDPANGERARALRDAGAWLSENSLGGERVMTVPIEVPYYARAVFLPLPEADEMLALRYVESKSPDYVVLTHDTARALYQEQWITHGLPGGSLLRRFGSGVNEVFVYEWHGDGPDHNER